MTIGAFTEVSGLSVSIDVEELAEGGQNQYTHKLPGRMKWPNLVLKRGITETDNLFQWFATSSGDGFAGAGNKIERRTGRVELRDATGLPVRRPWWLIAARHAALRLGRLHTAEPASAPVPVVPPAAVPAPVRRAPLTRHPVPGPGPGATASRPSLAASGPRPGAPG